MRQNPRTLRVPRQTDSPWMRLLDVPRASESRNVVASDWHVTTQLRTIELMNRDSEVTALRETVEHLVQRVDALEQRSAGDGSPAEPDSSSPHVLWALDGLKRRLVEHPATSNGAILLTGALTLPTGEPVEWQQAAGTAELIESDWSGRVVSISALAHPVRLELLRQVLLGVRTTAALAETDTLGSTGQLHHHLRQLVAGGWLRHSGRGSYEIPAARVVPLLVTLTAVLP